MRRYLLTLLLALGMASVAVAAEGDRREVVIYESGDAAWTASHLAAGEYIDNRRRWVAARVQYAMAGSTISGSFVIRGCEAGRGDGVAWSVDMPSKGQEAIGMSSQVKFFWPDAAFHNTFTIVAVQLCKVAEADGWFGR